MLPISMRDSMIIALIMELEKTNDCQFVMLHGVGSALERVIGKEALADQRIKTADQSGAYGVPATRMWSPYNFLDLSNSRLEGTIA